MKVSRFIIVLMLFSISIPLLTGCWNSRELSTLAIVSAIGIDKSPKKNEYRVSFQIINPSENTAGTTGGGGGKATAVFVTTGTGSTLFEAIRKTSRKVPRQLFFAHIRLVIIGETVAKEGISELFDLFERAREARLTSSILIARGTTAESVLSMITPLERISGYSTVDKLESTEKVWAENIKTEIDDVIRALVSDGSQPAISGVKVLGDIKQGELKANVEQAKPLAILEISGIAIFKGGKLQDWMDNGESRGFMLVKNKVKSTIVKLNCQKKKDGIAIEATGSKTKVKTTFKDGKPVIHILVREEGNVAEVKCPADLSNPKEIAKLEKEWMKETKKEVLSAVKIAQKEKSDIFGFGEVVNRQYPKEWEKLKQNWDNTFSDIQVQVDVEAFIRRPGMGIKPYILEEQSK
ncbi:Ger(x)C family spore germination protein [Neobacillus massiliamazoniensis]|uniref:Ger(X)C family germination protein n=1 Tax=Neobacillus massiliamazoniensis TaxID=1499688 RepID=A0A0U1NT97_9BACI|nr:Ger(x)C family spore germination protein [Neobacillus massiliamazoniensis]CRK81279.1 Ger(x)C family germination protein [Neobacillus massiliamazoniensis]